MQGHGTFRTPTLACWSASAPGTGVGWGEGVGAVVFRHVTGDADCWASWKAPRGQAQIAASRQCPWSAGGCEPSMRLTPFFAPLGPARATCDPPSRLTAHYAPCSIRPGTFWYYMGGRAPGPKAELIREGGWLR